MPLVRSTTISFEIDFVSLDVGSGGSPMPSRPPPALPLNGPRCNQPPPAVSWTETPNFQVSGMAARHRGSHVGDITGKRVNDPQGRGMQRKPCVPYPVAYLQPLHARI
ncbi:hypothetical protein BKA70DRAFT_1570976 [Coprinopsis sp. MPI-PUGE-AT-0042]|nr:hypothetical protein BKA70DRAFT_1570976 [Coprinopsis sp. MPI-PUGE-AT-0042]